VIGAVIPVLPFFVFAGRSAVTTSMGVSAVALFTLGAAITLMTGRRVLSSGLRQLGFGLAAAGLTYAVGHLIGVGVTPECWGAAMLRSRPARAGHESATAGQCPASRLRPG